MADYNPFDRGEHPVGTRSFTWNDETRERELPVDVWYPATAAFRGQDLDPETMDHYAMIPGTPEVPQRAVRDADARPGQYPLVVFSHGYGGERRQSTFLYSHLASHGYVVAAMDHVGNTTEDMMSGGVGDEDAMIRFTEQRPADVSFVIDRMLNGDAGLEIIASQIGLAGHSFGGWTTLKTTGTDDRIRAALPLAPAGGNTSDEPAADDVMTSSLDFDWQRVVPTLYIVADLDSVLPLAGMEDLYSRTPEPKRSVILHNADHFHFNDYVEQTHDGFKVMMQMISDGADEETQRGMQETIGNMKTSAELCPGEHAYTLIGGLGLAHFDAYLRGDAEAQGLIKGDLVALMSGRGIDISMMV